MNKKFVRAFALVLAALMCLSLLPLAQTSELSQAEWESESSDDPERAGREVGVCFICGSFR